MELFARADLRKIDPALSSNFVIDSAFHSLPQSWTVIRRYSDFVSLRSSLLPYLPSLPPPPPQPAALSGGGGGAPASSSRSSSSNNNSNNNNNNNSANHGVNSANHGLAVKHSVALNVYLINLLSYPGVRESPSLRRFLCDNANVVPLEYTGNVWFEVKDSRELDDMDMDDMFYSEQGNEQGSDHHAAASQAAHGTAHLKMDRGGGGGGCEVEDDDDEVEDFSMLEAERVDGVGSFSMEYLENSE